jgi:hypothetical protein
MARLFTEGFEDGYLFLDNQSWTGSGNIHQGGRSGKLMLDVGNGGGGIHVNLPSPSLRTEIFLRWAVVPNFYGDGDQVRLYSNASGGNNLEVKVQYGVGTPVRVVVGSTTRITSDIVTAAGLWHLIELRYKLASSGGVVELKIEGSTQGSWTGNTAPNGGTGITAVKWNLQSLGGPAPNYLDDVAINDTLDSVDDSWCGDGRVVGLRPDTTGNSAQWTKGGTTINTNNFQQVNELQSNLTTTYVYSATSGQIDLYGVEALNLQATDSIKRVWAGAVAREETADGDSLKVGIRTGGQEYWSDPLTLTTNWQNLKGPEYTTNPSTSTAWTQSEVNALEVGVQV